MASVRATASSIDVAAVAGPGRKVLVGLLGAGIGGSRTPMMHEAEGAHLGLRYVYQLLDTDRPDFAGLDAGALVQTARAFGFSGLNVTFPYKQSVMGLLDELSDNAARVGAVNTIVFDQGRARGHNTDLWGFAEAFRRNMAGTNLGRVALFGAGGAGAAVSRALLQLGAGELLLVDVEPARAEALAARLRDDFASRQVLAVSVDELAGRAVDGLVNTTPVGMAKAPGLPMDERLVQPDRWVADIIYFPLETALLALARQRGCRTMSGAPMAVFQAVRAFELFSGLKPDEARMRAIFDAF